VFLAVNSSNREPRLQPRAETTAEGRERAETKPTLNSRVHSRRYSGIGIPADVARGHGGSGDDRPPSRQIFTGCREHGEGRKTPTGEKGGTERQGKPARRGDPWRGNRKPFGLRKIRMNKARKRSVFEYNDRGTLLTSPKNKAGVMEPLGWRLQDSEYQSLIQPTSTTPYLLTTSSTQDEARIQYEEMPRLKGFGGKGRDVISINDPRCTHTDADVDEVKEEHKRLRKELNMLRTVVRSDDRMSQLLTQLESQHEVGGGNGSGGGGDDEPGADEDAGGDEDTDGDEGS
ncbi:hypothetical protein Tco_0201607, partial [Tanacetum coccineum]